MKKFTFLSLATLLTSATVANAYQAHAYKPPVAPDPEPPPLYQVPATAPSAAEALAPAPQPIYVYDQKPLQSAPTLISPQAAQEIVERFRSNYAKMDSPRVLIYVNRELVDEQSGIRVTHGTHTTESTSQLNAGSGATNAAQNQTTKSTVNNDYREHDVANAPLADRQTVRDVERLIGRPLRTAGVTLVDQKTATQLMGNRPMKDLLTANEGQQASKDREALGKIADVVLEVLISSRSVTVPEVSGDRTYTVPDIQATAIRLKDSKLIGQASAADIMGRGQSAGYNARSFSTQDITEATAIGLMEDMLRGVQ